MAKSQPTIRVKLKAYDSKVLDVSTKSIAETAIRTGSKVSGPIPLPTKIEKVTVTRGPHVDKRGKEIFETRTHNRLLDILEPTPQTIDELSNKLNIPAGVEVSIRAR